MGILDFLDIFLFYEKYKEQLDVIIGYVVDYFKRLLGIATGEEETTTEEETTA